jgi:HPt (histidine-containing phosphotransfer) domain-containing protein
MKGDRERCLDVGMDGYVSKPVRARDLFETMEETVADYGRCPRGQEVPDGVDVANWNELLESVQGDRQLLRELVEIFLGESPALWERVRQSWERQDSSQLEKAAHALKGSARVFGANPVYDLCCELEAAARAGRVDGEMPKMLDSLERELEVLVESLRLMLNDLPTQRVAH